MSAIDKILWMLKNGKWYNLDKIIEKCSSLESEVKMAVSFLCEYNFIQMNENSQKARLHPMMFEFINEIQRVEKEEASSYQGFERVVGTKEFGSPCCSSKQM